MDTLEAISKRTSIRGYKLQPIPKDVLEKLVDAGRRAPTARAVEPAAADLGLGACWVAGDKKPYTKEVAELLNAPSDMKLISLLSLGWPDSHKDQEKNRSLKDVLHWEKF